MLEGFKVIKRMGRVEERVALQNVSEDAGSRDAEERGSNSGVPWNIEKKEKEIAE